MGTETTATHVEAKKVTAADLKEMGLKLTKTRKVIDYSPTDGNKNAAILLTKYKAELTAIYKKIMRLADGKITHNEKEFPVSVSEAQRDWILNPAADLHDAALQALESGVRPAVVTDVCPAS